MQQEEELWQRLLKSTIVISMQPDELSSKFACACALVRHLAPLRAGINHIDSDGGLSEGFIVDEDAIVRLQTSAADDVNAAGVPRRASSYDAYREKMDLQGVGRCLRGHMLGTRKLLELATPPSLQSSSSLTIILARGRHAACHATLAWWMSDIENCRVGDGFLAVSVPVDVVQDALQRADAALLASPLIGHWGVSAWLPTRGKRSSSLGDDLEYDMKALALELDLKALDDRCVPWVLECFRCLPLDDSSSDEGEGQGLWQRSLLCS